MVMATLGSRLIQRLKVLPQERVTQVFDFVEFLASCEQRGAAAQRLTKAMARLDALFHFEISRIRGLGRRAAGSAVALKAEKTTTRVIWERDEKKYLRRP